MTLVVQSSGDSLRTAAASASRTLTTEVPPAVVAGDMLCVAVSTSCPCDIRLTATRGGETVNDPLPSVEWRKFVGTEGAVSFGYSQIPDKATADLVKSFDSLIVDLIEIEAPEEGDEGMLPGITVAVFRVTGADTRRFIEDAKSVTGDLAAEGELTVPSFDPEYRRDNTILFVASATFPVGSATPQITAGRSTPVTSIMASPSSENGESMGVTTSVSIRTLSSADPTGVTPVSFSSQPASGLGVALMLRSENRPPVINLAPEWAAEVGREAVVSATVTDPDFTPVSYVWSQLDGPEPVAIGNVYARAFNFTPTLPGIYRFVLRATDVDGGRTEIVTSVIVPTGTTGPAEVTASDGWVDQDGGTIEAVELADGLDTTFARTEDLPLGDPLTVRLNPVYGGAAVTLTVRGVASNPSPEIRRTLTLKQSDGALIAERSYILPTVMGSYVFTTTRNETELITNRSAMTLTIVDEVA